MTEKQSPIAEELQEDVEAQNHDEEAGSELQQAMADHNREMARLDRNTLQTAQGDGVAGLASDRTRLIREQQRSGGGEITAVMVSREGLPERIWINPITLQRGSGNIYRCSQLVEQDDVEFARVHTRSKGGEGETANTDAQLAEDAAWIYSKTQTASRDLAIARIKERLITIARYRTPSQVESTGEGELSLETVLWAAANFISSTPDRRPPKQREAVLKGLDWAIERFTGQVEPGAKDETTLNMAVWEVLHDFRGILNELQRTEICKEVVKRLRASTVVESEAAWRPIEEAPKDGSKFPALWPFWNNYEWAVTTYWNANRKEWASDEINDHPIARQPTHYFALPPPPQSKQEKE